MTTLQFSELSQEAKEVAVDQFIKDAEPIFGADTNILNRDVIQAFLSMSRVHRYDETGNFIGINRRKTNVNV